jgi:AcrR family transcriptional regulator
VTPVGRDEISDAVLDAARAAFGARGYAKTTIKGVAAAAGVTPAVVRKYYDNKERLFAAALRLPFDPASAVPELVAPGLDGMGERLVRFTFDTLGDPEVRKDLGNLFKAGSSAGKATQSIQDFLEESVVDRVVAAVGVPDARMRVALITSYLTGVAAARYVLRMEPLASAPEDEVVRLVAPTIQDLLDPSKPLPGKG